MVTFLLPRTQALVIPECPETLHGLPMVREAKEPLRVSFHRTSSKSPERVRHRTDTEEKHQSRYKSSNSWFRSITSSFMNGGGGNSTTPSASSPPNAPHTTTTSQSPYDSAPTHVRRRTRSLVDTCRGFTSSHSANVDPRLPDHMKRPELQLRRIQRRDIPASSKTVSSRSSSAERAQKYSLWWPS